MSDLFIIGAGGTSREIIDVVENINRDGHRWNICGILDDDPSKLGQTINDVPVIGPVSLSTEKKGLFIIGIASFKNRWVRKQIVERLALEPKRYASLIHPSAQVSRWSQIGSGTVIQRNVIVGPQVHIGNHVVVSSMTFIGHDTNIADFVTMAPQVCLSGSVQVGECAYLGAGARVRDSVTIGVGALVGIGSVVLSTVETSSTVFGNPARRVQ